MSNEIFLHNNERKTVKELKEEKNSYYNYYPNYLFENIPDVKNNELNHISSYEILSKIKNENEKHSYFGEFEINNDLENTHLYFPSLPREPTDFVSILSFPYTNKNNYRLKTTSSNTFNNIQNFSTTFKKNTNYNDNIEKDKPKNEHKEAYKSGNNYQLWNQIPKKKAFLTSKSNNWDLKDKDNKVYSYDNGIPFQSPYLSEVNLSLYEEVYQLYYNHQYSYGQYNKIVEEKDLIKDILNMVVGISSRNFIYDTSKEQFSIKNIKIQYLRIVGCDGQSLSKYIQTYLDMGTNFKRLEKLTKIYQSNPEIYGLIGISFSHSLASYLSFVRACIIGLMNSKLIEKIHILELNNVLKQFIYQINMLSRLCACNASDDFKSLKIKSPQLLSILYENACIYDFSSNLMTYRETLFKYVIYSLLKDSSELYFNWIKMWIGLDNLSDNEFYSLNDYHHEFYIHYIEPLSPSEKQTSTSISEEESKNGDQFWTHEWQIDINIQIPSFIPEKLAEKLFHSGKCLRLLKECCPDHPLFYNYKESKTFIYWIFNENNIEKLHQSLNIYETEIKNNIHIMTTNIKNEKKRLEEQKKLEMLSEDKKEKQRLHTRRESKLQQNLSKQKEKQKYYNELKNMQILKQKKKEQENEKLQKIKDEEENEEQLKQDAINLLSKEMKREYEAKMKDLEYKMSSDKTQEAHFSEYDHGNKRKWISDENSINSNKIDDNDDNKNNNHNRHNTDTNNSLKQSQILNNRVDQESIINQVTENIMLKSESQNNLSHVLSNVEHNKNTNNTNSEIIIRENNDSVDSVHKINNNKDDPSTSVNNENVNDKIKSTEIKKDKEAKIIISSDNNPSSMNTEYLNDNVDTISIALDDHGEFKLKDYHKSTQPTINNNHINNLSNGNTTFNPLLSLSPFQLSSSPQPPPSQPEIKNPFNLYFGFKKSTGIFGNLMTSSIFSNDDLLNNINTQPFSIPTNQSEVNNDGTLKSNYIEYDSVNKDTLSKDSNININSQKLGIETSSKKLQFNVSNNSNNSITSSKLKKENNSIGGGGGGGILKPKLEKTKSYQNLHKLNIFTTDSGDEISMIEDYSEPEESSLGYSLNQSLNLFNDQISVNHSTTDDKFSKKFEKRTKETAQNYNNEDILNDSEITKKAKQNAKDSLLKFIPKIIDENINTNELKLFKYNFDNFDFSNIILMNNYLNNAKQINSFQVKLHQDQQQKKQQPLNSSNSSLNFSLNESYEISAPFSSIFEHTVIHAINKQNEIIDFSVMNYFMVNLEFVQQLKLLSSFYLMNDGNYVCQLKDILFDSRNGINVLKINNPLKLNFNLIVNNLNDNSLISSTANFIFTNNNKVTSDNLSRFDFLSLNYTPKYPLNIQITSSILKKYNRIMAFLLKLLALQNCVDQLNNVFHLSKRSGKGRQQVLNYPLIIKFRMEVINFVKQFSYYIHEIAIKQTWQQFMDCVLDIEEFCNQYHQPDDDDDDDDDDSDSDSKSDDANSSEIENEMAQDSSERKSSNDNYSLYSTKSKEKNSSFKSSNSSNHKTRSIRSTTSLRSSHKKTSKANLQHSTSYEILNNDLLSATAPKTHNYHGLKIEYNFEGLYLLHHDYLKCILYRCFLLSAAEPIQNLLNNIFNIIEKFCYHMVFGKRIDKDTIDELYSLWKSKHSLFINKLEFLINKDLVQGNFNTNGGKEGRWIFNELLI
ncbi:hypothetical protein BCR36DRAFT_349614, partial [Piromyces finnis]